MSIRTILLVEDEALDRLLLTGWLNKALPGLTLLQAGSLRDAQLLLASHRVDAILLDLGLSDGYGLPTLQKMLELAPQAPVVVLSSLADRAMALQAVQQGAQDYLIKGQVSGALLLRSLQYAVERKKHEQIQQAQNSELAEKNRALHHSEQVRRQFVANASHELRNPLTAVRASVEALEMAGIAGAPAQRFLTSALRNLDRLDALIEDMLTLAQVNTGHAALCATPQRLASLVGHAVQAATVSAEARNISIEQQMPDDLPELMLDGSKMTGILDNLLSNALKYSTAGTTVRLQAAPATMADGARCVELRVVDQGLGIKSGDYKGIFLPFVRGAHSNTKIPGTGLGLSIVREYVQMHRGTVWAEPAPGRGTTFVVQLPC